MKFKSASSLSLASFKCKSSTCALQRFIFTNGYFSPSPIHFSLLTTFFFSSNSNLSNIATPTFSVQIFSKIESSLKYSTASVLQVRRLISHSVFESLFGCRENAGKVTGFFLINQTGGASFLVFVVRFFFGFELSRVWIVWAECVGSFRARFADLLLCKCSVTFVVNSWVKCEIENLGLK